MVVFCFWWIRGPKHKSSGEITLLTCNVLHSFCVKKNDRWNYFWTCLKCWSISRLEQEENRKRCLALCGSIWCWGAMIKLSSAEQFPLPELLPSWEAPRLRNTLIERYFPLLLVSLNKLRSGFAITQIFQCILKFHCWILWLLKNDDVQMSNWFI